MFLKKEKVLHCKFECSLCGTDIELPLCCKKDSVKIINGKVVCNMCGTEEEVPVCCDEKVMYVGVE